MSLPLTGPLRLGQVLTELGQTGAVSLASGGSRSLAGTLTGPISMSQLRGKSLRGAQFITSSTVYTVPANFTQLRILLVSGGSSTGVGAGSGGGAGGSIATTSSFAVMGGDQLIITVGEGSAAGPGGASSVTNPRTGQAITTRNNFAGQRAVGSIGARGGATFDEISTTLAGGVGAQGLYGGGGAGAGLVGSPATTSSVGGGAAARAVVLNSTQTVYLSPGGSGVGPVVTQGPVIISSVGAGASHVGQAGGAGVVIIY